MILENSFASHKKLSALKLRLFPRHQFYSSPTVEKKTLKPHRKAPPTALARNRKLNSAIFFYSFYFSLWLSSSFPWVKIACLKTVSIETTALQSNWISTSRFLQSGGSDRSGMSGKRLRVRTRDSSSVRYDTGER